MDDDARACCTIAGRKARSRRTAANRLVSNACCQSASDNAKAPPPGAGGTTDVVDQNIEAAETLHDHLDDLIDPCARTDVCLDEPIARAARGQGSCRGDHRATAAPEALHDGFAYPLVPPVTSARLPVNSVSEDMFIGVSPRALSLAS